MGDFKGVTEKFSVDLVSDDGYGSQRVRQACWHLFRQLWGSEAVVCRLGPGSDWDAWWYEAVTFLTCQKRACWRIQISYDTVLSDTVRLNLLPYSLKIYGSCCLQKKSSVSSKRTLPSNVWCCLSCCMLAGFSCCSLFLRIYCCKPCVSQYHGNTTHDTLFCKIAIPGTIKTVPSTPESHSYTYLLNESSLYLHWKCHSETLFLSCRQSPAWGSRVGVMQICSMFVV